MSPTCLALLESPSCKFRIERRGRTLVLVRIEGHDVGEFGDTPMRCIEALLPEGQPAELFVDARARSRLARPPRRRLARRRRRAKH